MNEKEPEESLSRTVGSIVGLITQELGAAFAVAGGLWVGYLATTAAHNSNEKWQLYMVAAVVFVGLAAVCRRPRST